MSDTAKTSLQSTSRSTFIVMVSTLLSRLLGFIRIALVSMFFGGDGKADILNLVFTVPNNLRKLLAEGALSSAFIPVLTESMVTAPDGSKARRIVGNLLAFQLAILVPFLFLTIIFAPQVSAIIFNFPDPGDQALAVDLFRWLISYILLISIASVLMGTLNSCNHFLVPAITPVLFSVTVIGSIIFLHESLGIFSMAVGVLTGGFAQILVQLPTFRSYGFSIKPDWNFSNPEFRKILRFWGPVVLSSAVFTVNQQIAVRFASGLEPGSGTALSNALVFWQLPFGIFSASVITVLYPRMSRQTALGETQGIRQTLTFGLRALFALLVPSAVLLMLLGKEIIGPALQRGAFMPHHTAMAAEVLLYLSIGLFFSASGNLFQRFFYSRKDFKTPIYNALLILVLDVGLSLWLKETVLRVAGLALANSIAAGVGLWFLFIRARKDLGGLNLRGFLPTFWKTCVSTLLMAGYIVVLNGLVFPADWWALGSTGLNWLRILVIGIGSVLIIVVSYIILKVEVVNLAFKKRLPPQ
ncbi:murein biosynthesis integral membrane protein MurJ [Spirochaeta lutea]|uniref:Probable lipid II flippase MurJ n=1 Tax=Spirochaeta lutea TaxID=1480694 RepID=A0A098R2E4_9SPIO|nr:murein biosynthesis integral membrane protein MurJ [Spirochaeta lutea]KGE73966.1 hypothetical protein DC28_01980 [Spirochaeta lutea]